jgi:site-specific recombinase XerD
MKLNSAKISLILRTNKEYSGGTHPIMIRIQYNGRKEKATGYSCIEKDWDKDKQELKRGYPNHIAINLQLKDMINRAEAIKYDFERKKIPYTPDMIFNSLSGERANTNELDIYVLIERYMQTQNIKIGTIYKYKNLLHKLKEFFGSKQILITSIDKEMIKKFDLWVSGKGYDDNYILSIYTNLSAILNYAIDMELIDKNVLLLSKVKKRHKSHHTHIAISYPQIVQLHNYYLHLIGFNIGTGSYNTQFAYSLRNKANALALFLFCYFAQGLAFVDIAKLKITDVKIEKKHNKKYGRESKRTYPRIEPEYIEYIEIYTKREKTKEQVPIVIQKTDSLFDYVITPYLDSAESRDGYLFPIYQNDRHSYKNDTEMDRYRLLKQAEYYVNTELKIIAKEADRYELDYLDKRKKEKIDKLPENLSFYVARHTFASVCIEKGMNPVELAILMGRSPEGIFRYVKTIKSNDRIIATKKNIEDMHSQSEV